ncbi:MAG: histidine phosphatase family protein [Bacteroidota bacterium]|nr:histidine phosphatase family protein [Bacteroidota bacterium]
MKTLLLIRHAKSSWDHSILSDFDRPLNERGKQDAPIAAKILRDKKINIDAFVSSPAKRAKKTAEIFLKEYDKKEKYLTLIPSLYEASTAEFYQVVEKLEDKYDSVALFSHNPGITDFINSLGCNPIYDMPTCAVYGLEINTKHWKAFKDSKKKFLFLDYPKKEQ